MFFLSFYLAIFWLFEIDLAVDCLFQRSSIDRGSSIEHDVQQQTITPPLLPPTAGTRSRAHLLPARSGDSAGPSRGCKRPQRIKSFFAVRSSTCRGGRTSYTANTRPRSRQATFYLVATKVSHWGRYLLRASHFAMHWRGVYVRKRSSTPRSQFQRSHRRRRQWQQSRVQLANAWAPHCYPLLPPGDGAQRRWCSSFCAG